MVGEKNCSLYRVPFIGMSQLHSLALHFIGLGEDQNNEETCNNHRKSRVCAMLCNSADLWYHGGYQDSSWMFFF